jgi:hypothetical protein
MTDARTVKAADHLAHLVVQSGGKPKGRLFALNLCADVRHHTVTGTFPAAPVFTIEQQATDADWYRADALVLRVIGFVRDGRLDSARDTVLNYVDLARQTA